MQGDNNILEKIEIIENKLPNPSMDGGIPSPNWEEIETLAQKMEKYNVPGLSIAVINNFEIEWSKQYGVIDNKSKKKVDASTLFEAGSTSKVFTALAVLNLVEKNLIKLDEPVNNYFKSWKIPDNEFTKENAVTLRHLLTHTSGMNRPDSMFNVEANKIPTVNQVLNGESPAINDPAVIEKIPGSEHQYSNLAFIAIEKLLQDVTNKETDEIMKDLIFKPLKLERSLATYPETETNIILPHDNEGNVQESGYVKGTFGCAGLISTPTDIAKVVLELMQTYQGYSNKIISKQTLKEMFRSQKDLDPTKFFGWTGQGLGIFLMETLEDLIFIHPGTNSPGAVCMMVGNLKTGQGLVVMSNGIRAELLHLEILFAIAKLYDWKVYQ